MSLAVSENSVSLQRVRLRLAVVWFGGCGPIFLILLIQSFSNVYVGQLTELWSWAMPLMLPTLSLIVSTLGAEALVPHKDGVKTEESFVVRRSFYMLAFWLSIAYLALILGTIIAQPIFMQSHAGPVLADEVTASFQTGVSEQPERAEMLMQSSLWLAPFQSLVVAAIGIVFFTKRKG